jgi:23S rRNA (cytidine1920-2'-O)/16S rRNA (cytidine1409-2'-O)-methyltransferase
VLLESGVRRVYAVDAGHGQLLGSLRQDPRVVNLENTNVSRLDTQLVPDAVELVTVDVSYLSLAAAVSQLARLRIAPDAELVGLVKPMFELRLPTAPTDQETADRAAAAASAGVAACGWRVHRVAPSPVTGARGAVEMLLHARRV